MNCDLLQQDPYECYLDYVRVKTHFCTDTYDIIKHKNKMRYIPRDTFENRSDKLFFFALSKKIGSNMNIPFFVSQFIENDKLCITDLFVDVVATEHRYNAWSNRISLLYENYIADMHTLKSKNMSWKELCHVDAPDYPEIFRMVSTKQITPETYTILNVMFGFIQKASEKLSNDALFRTINLKYMKYERFLPVNIKKYLAITPKLCIN